MLFLTDETQRIIRLYVSVEISVIIFENRVES